MSDLMLKDLFALAPKDIGFKEWLRKLWFERPFPVFLFKAGFQLLCEIIFLPLALLIYGPQLLVLQLEHGILLLQRKALLLKRSQRKKMLEKVEHKQPASGQGG